METSNLILNSACSPAAIDILPNSIKILWFSKQSSKKPLYIWPPNRPVRLHELSPYYSKYNIIFKMNSRFLSLRSLVPEAIPIFPPENFTSIILTVSILYDRYNVIMVSQTLQRSEHIVLIASPWLLSLVFLKLNLSNWVLHLLWFSSKTSLNT